MGKFSNYIDNINQQMGILRENLSKVSKLDCSKNSIADCAEIVEDYINPEDRRYGLYITPDWYPDIENIIYKAPNITKDGKIYYPSYIVLTDNSEDVTPFYRNGAPASDYRSTGGEAVLCSDKCDNILNVNSDMLEVGNNIEHIWDKSKDIFDPSQKTNYGVRWYITYTTSTSTTSGGNIRDKADITKIEQVIHQYTSGYYTTASGTQEYSPSLKKLTYTSNYTFNPSSSYTPASLTFRGLLKLVFKTSNALKTQKLYYSNEVDFDYSNESSLSYQYPRKYIKFPNNIKNLSDINIANNSSIVIPNTVETMTNCFTNSSNTSREIILPEGLLSISGGLTSLYYLDYIKIPSTLQTWINTSSNTLSYTFYVELYEDFNISNVTLSGNKSIYWLKDLCKWLKDRTNEEANILIIGSTNINKAQNIWLTFNPNNKRDITWVAAGTEGAINIVQFITEQLNWTLS